MHTVQQQPKIQSGSSNKPEFSEHRLEGKCSFDGDTL